MKEIQDKLLKDPNYRPSVVVEESTKMVDAAGAALFDLRSQALVHVLEFYRLIEQMKALRGVFESAAFLTILPASRAGYIQDLWDAARDASSAGGTALQELVRMYPKVTFPS